MLQLRNFRPPWCPPWLSPRWPCGHNSAAVGAGALRILARILLHGRRASIVARFLYLRRPRKDPGHLSGRGHVISRDIAWRPGNARGGSTSQARPLVAPRPGMLPPELGVILPAGEHERRAPALPGKVAHVRPTAALRAAYGPGSGNEPVSLASVDPLRLQNGSPSARARRLCSAWAS